MIAGPSVRLLGMRPGRRNSEEELPTRRRYIGARVVVSELRPNQRLLLMPSAQTDCGPRVVPRTLALGARLANREASS
jgi:hypothetical protein